MWFWIMERRGHWALGRLAVLIGIGLAAAACAEPVIDDRASVAETPGYREPGPSPWLHAPWAPWEGDVETYHLKRAGIPRERFLSLFAELDVDFEPVNTDYSFARFDCSYSARKPIDDQGQAVCDILTSDLKELPQYKIWRRAHHRHTGQRYSYVWRRLIVGDTVVLGHYLETR